MFVEFFVILEVLACISAQGIRRSAARRAQALDELQGRLDELTTAPNQPSSQSCRISSENLLAAAEATAKGVLQGVCNPREIEDRLHNIESQTADQFTIIKTMILNVEEKMAAQENSFKKYLRKLLSSIEEIQASCGRGGRGFGKLGGQGIRQQGAAGQLTGGSGNASTAAAGSRSELPAQASSDPIGGNAQSPGRTRSQQGKNRPSSAQLPSRDFDVDEDEFEDEEAEAAPNPRQIEIDKFNNTIHVENGKRVFTFYWRVDDMEYKLDNWGIKRSLRSNSFYIFQYGYMMYMRLYPRQDGRNLYVHVGLTKGEFDEALEWPFTLKHRVTIIDQSNSPVDIMSRIWDPQVLCSEWNWRRPQNPPNNDNYECVGLGLPHDDVKSRNYVDNNSILLKLTVFLDPIFS